MMFSFFLSLLLRLLLLSSLSLPSLATSSLRWAQRASTNTTSLALRALPVVSASVSVAPRTTSYSPAGGYCDSAVFSVQHFNESGAGPWYAEWVYNEIHGNTSADWESRVSEPQYFALKTLRLMDLDCGVAHKGCVNMPNCEEILERVGGDVKVARNIYYILQSFHNMNLVSGVIAEQTLSAETNLLGMSASIANTFFWKWDKTQSDKCDLAVGLIKTAQQVIQVGLLMAMPEIGVIAAVPAEITAAAETAEVAAAAKTVKLAWLPESFRAAVTKVDKVWRSGTVWEPAEGLKKLEAVKPWAWRNHVPYSVAKFWNTYGAPPIWQTIPVVALGSPMNFETNPLMGGVCGAFPNPDKNAVESYTRQLDMVIQRSGREYRTEMESLVADLNRGIGSGENGAFDSDRSTLMSEQIILGQYAQLSPAAHERFVNNPSITEQVMTTSFEATLISAALKSQMCHLHCSPADPGHGNDCTSFKDIMGDELSKSRFCPRPGVVCQAQCWRNSPHSKVVELYGVGELTSANSPWDFDFGSFLQESYDHWQDHRGQPDHMFPSVDDLLSDKVTDPFGSFLPVCYDEHIRPDDFLGKGDKSIPCTCGDAYGNETAMFFKAAGFDNWVELAEDRKALGERCMRNMYHAKVAPVEQFMTFCELGSHWPVQGEHHPKMMDGKDKRCDEMAQLVDELRGKGVDEDGITCNVCFASEVGRSIQADQRNSVVDGMNWLINKGRFHDNMKTGCHLWSTKYEGNPPPCTLAHEAALKEFGKWANLPNNGFWNLIHH